MHGHAQPVGQAAGGVVGEQQDGDRQPVGEQPDDPPPAVDGRVGHQPGEHPAEQHDPVGRQAVDRAHADERQGQPGPEQEPHGDAPRRRSCGDGDGRLEGGERREERRWLDRGHGGGRYPRRRLHGERPGVTRHSFTLEGQV